MKSWALLAIACAVSTQTSLLSPATAADEGAKGLYFEQLDKPSDPINTGIQYWIELHQGNKVSRANNKTSFHAGDRIRFHLKPNIDGFAYIVLKSGSRGEQAVLFPDTQRQESNQINRGKEIILPTDGTLAFDDNPGVEKIMLVVSRKPIDPNGFMGETKPSVPRIAMSSIGSKDLVPNRVFVAYNDAPLSSPPPVAETKTPSRPVSTESTSVATKPKSTPTHIAPKAVVKHKPTKNTSAKPAPQQTASAVTDSSVVTVVYNDPTGILAADISLEHQ